MLSIEYILYDKCLYNCINIFLKFKNWVIPYSIWQKTKKNNRCVSIWPEFLLAIAFEFYLKYLLCCMHANPSGQWVFKLFQRCMRIRSQGKQVQVYFSTSYSFPIKSLIINDTLIETLHDRQIFKIRCCRIMNGE